MSTDRKRHFWIDTDAGTDDAVALIMAMKHPSVEIVGISTSGGNVPLDCVVQNVLYLRELCNGTAPVYVGAAQPMNRILGTADFIHGKDGLGDIGLPLHGRVAESGDSTEALIQAITTYDDLEIICLGPLTNLAYVEQAQPGIVSSLYHLFVMGGLVDLPGNVTPLAEYNIWADPEAADIILKAGADTTMIGWDTTLKSGGLGDEEVQRILDIGTDLSKLCIDIQGVRLQWMKEAGEELTILLADALAMAVALRPESAVSSERYDMSIASDRDDEEQRGYIVAKPAQQGILHIKEVDRKMYLDLICEALT